MTTARRENVIRPLLVGEDNPYGTDPRYALYPAPDQSAGARLCKIITGFSLKDKLPGVAVRQYIKNFERANLCERKWSMREARDRAYELRRTRASANPVPIVLCGAKVSDAFGVDYVPFEISDRFTPAGLPDGSQRVLRFVVLPHPSGRNRLWNTSDAVARARAVLYEAGVLPLPRQKVCEYCEKHPGLCQCPVDDEGDLLRTENTTKRPAKCSNCGIVVRGSECSDCGPP